MLERIVSDVSGISLSETRTVMTFSFAAVFCPLEAGAELSFSPPEPQAARANNSRSARASDSGFLSFILISPYRSIIVRKRLPASEA